MASNRTQHLDATAGREVIFCHQCQHEWYKDEHGDSLVCPNCHGEATEIVDPHTDPRPPIRDPLSDLDHHQPHRRPFADTDSDPDEADIEDHFVRGPPDFFGRRTIYRSPNRADAQNAGRTAPDDGEAIIRRFTEMLGDIGGGPGTVGRSGPETLFPENGGPHITYRTISGPGFRGGVSSFTITTGPAGGRVRHGGMSPGPAGDEDFTRVLGNLFGGIASPPMPPRSPGGADDADANANNPDAHRDARQQDIVMALNQIFSSFINPRAVQGDAVYSQEALDRIITNLMEANPQSNAPPPASEDAIKHLPKKKLDAEMLGPELKGECTICIDDMGVGDEVTVLPCKHWFHNDCVVLWLRQHNTCPICRAPITGEAAGQPGGAAPAAEPGPSGSSPFSRPSGAAERRRSNIRTRGEARLDSIRDFANPYSHRETSRRNSNSPPRETGSTPSSRVRSPSPSSRRSTNSEQTRERSSTSSSNPLHWFRDRFGGDRRH